LVLKILLYGINFAPELTGIGKYTGEMAAWLVAQGHQVRVVTAPPYYPDWRVAASHRNAWYHHTWQGVQVWRCPLWVPRQPGGLKRLVHLASFAASSLPVVLRQAVWRPDVVWVVEPATFCAPAAWLTARMCGAKAWLHVQDFEVDAAFDMGLLKGQRLRQWVHGVERWVKNRFHVVSTISGRMHQRLHAKGLYPSRTELAPNWVDISTISPRPAHAGPNPYRAELGLPPHAVVALYSGNMGGKQGLEVLADAARLCQRPGAQAPGAAALPPIEFVFCGNGAGRAELQSRAQGLLNVRFMDLQPMERLNDLLALADIHLLPQRADAADLVMPSKLTGMLASGRPVVATANPGTELAHVVAGDNLPGAGPEHVSAEPNPCGMVVAPEDPQALAMAIQHLAAHPQLRAQMGASARAHAEEFLHIDAVLARWVARAERELGWHPGSSTQPETGPDTTPAAHGG
jgi:colanic acid biosynthesis glycosyl transferase WcaI